MDINSRNGKTTVEAAGKVDLRNVFLDAETDNGVDEYVLLQKKRGRKVKKGQAGVELIRTGLKTEGII